MFIIANCLTPIKIFFCMSFHFNVFGWTSPLPVVRDLPGHSPGYARGVGMRPEARRRLVPKGMTLSKVSPQDPWGENPRGSCRPEGRQDLWIRVFGQRLCSFAATSNPKLRVKAKNAVQRFIHSLPLRGRVYMTRPGVAGAGISWCPDIPVGRSWYRPWLHPQLCWGRGLRPRWPKRLAWPLPTKVGASRDKSNWPQHSWGDRNFYDCKTCLVLKVSCLFVNAKATVVKKNNVPKRFK